MTVTTVHRTLPLTLKIPTETQAHLTLEEHTQTFQAENLDGLMKKVTAAMGREVTSNGAEFLPVALMDATTEAGAELIFGVVGRDGGIVEDPTPDKKTERKARVEFARWSAELRDDALPAPEAPEVLPEAPAAETPGEGGEAPEETHRGWTGLMPAVSAEETAKACQGQEDQLYLPEPVRHVEVPATVDNDLPDYVADDEELGRLLEKLPEDTDEEEDLAEFRMQTLAEARQGQRFAKQGVQGRLNALGLTLPPGTLESDYLRDVKTIAEAPWDSPKRFAIGNPKGGVLKSTTELFLMAVLARSAPIQAVLVDFNEAIGNSLERSGVVGNTTETVKTLAQWVERLDHEPTRAELRRFTRAHPTDRYHHIAAHEPSTSNDRMFGHDVENVYRALDTSYDLIGADTGNSMDRETWAVTMQTVDQLVIPIVDKDSYDGAVKMMRTLIRWGGATADLARNAIVVITNKGNALSKAKIAEYKKDWEKEVTGGVFVIPNDKHQPADGLSIDRLQFKTLAAYTKAAAQITRALHAEV